MAAFGSDTPFSSSTQKNSLYTFFSDLAPSGPATSSNQSGHVYAPGVCLNSKTKHLGFSISTYQNAADPKFASRSNWGEYQREHFTAAQQKEHLASGGGVDILTPEGRELTCDLILQTGGNTLRFSVEWADIQPTRSDFFNEHAMAKYIEAAEYIKSRGITPIITLHHFVDPLWFSQARGFEREENIQYFVEYAQFVYRRLAPHVEHIVTFNEPAVYATMGYILGDFPPNRKGEFGTHENVLTNMMNAHVRCYDALHEDALEKHREIQVGLTHQALKFVPASTWNFPARGVCSVMTYRFHSLFMELAKANLKKFDFFGVQYYTRPLIGGIIPHSTCEPEEEMVESMDFRFDPSGIGELLEEVAEALPGVELMVTETGTAGDSDDVTMDERRARYYRKSLKAVSKVQAKGIPIIAYLPWTLFCNFEWNHGYSPKHDFGVVHRRKGSSEIRLTEAYYVLQEVFKRTLALGDLEEIAV